MAQPPLLANSTNFQVQLGPDQNNSVKPSPLATILDELVPLITQNLDMPSRFALSWTCRRFAHITAGEDFHPYHFADQCAQLGYRTLLEYGVSLGAPFDERTSCLAAESGDQELLELYLTRQGSQGSNLLLRRWAHAAAKAGNQELLSWLKVDEWADPGYLLIFAKEAAVGGQTALMLQFLFKMSDISMIVCTDILSSCIQGDQVETLLRAINVIRQTVYAGYQMTEEYIYDRIVAGGEHFGSHRVIAWLLETAPAFAQKPYVIDRLTISGCKHGSLPLLALVKEHIGSFNPRYIRAIVQDYAIRPNSQHFECLRFIHANFDLATSPLQDAIALPLWATREAAEWMEAKGYRFQTQGMLENYLKEFQFLWDGAKNAIDMNLIAWMVKKGAPVTAEALGWAACTCNTALLEWLRQTRPAINPDGEPLASIADPIYSLLLAVQAHWLAAKTLKDIGQATRMHLSPIRKTLAWLLTHGFQFSPDSKQLCQKFVADIMDLSNSIYPPKLIKLRQLIELLPQHQAD